MLIAARACLLFWTQADPWHFIRPLIDGFNQRRHAVIIPGQGLCIDECMSAWRGSDGKYVVDGMPHVTKIMRKPEGVGCEMKATACAETGILLYLELQEGHERMQMKKYQQRTAHAPHDAAYDAAAASGDVFKYSTAVTLRCAEHYIGSRRHVVADSAFASVETLLQLRKRGLHFSGIVKTASKEYPKAILKA